MRYALILFVAVSLSGVGCHTISSKKEKVAQDDIEKARALATGISQKSLSDEELRQVGKQIATDPEARSAVESITESLQGNSQSVKYCPKDGKRFASHLTECPEHHIPLEWVE